jgi:hypothetical protein
MESIMELAHFNGLMEVFTRENGRIAEKMARGNSLELMELYMKVNGLMGNTMERVNLLLLMEKCT